LQKCENNIIFNYFARSYSILMLNIIKLIWKELLSFIHFMGLSWKKKFKKIQANSRCFKIFWINSKYFKISTNISRNLLETFFVYIMDEHIWISSVMMLAMMLNMMLGMSSMTST
jgi:hypothetical protein